MVRRKHQRHRKAIEPVVEDEDARNKTMNQLSKTIRYGLAGVLFAFLVDGSVLVANAQETEPAKPTAEKREQGVGRDPFRRYEAPRIVVKKVAGQVLPPSIQERIAQYKAQKLAAMNARMAAPKPTTALLLNEVQVIGVSRSPRGYAAIVDATPIKLSYVIYPGERFYDGQLVAIEDNRLVFRREIVFTDGRRERTVEVKPLRQPKTTDLMSTGQVSPAGSSSAESARTSEQTPTTPTKP